MREKRGCKHFGSEECTKVQTDNVNSLGIICCDGCRHLDEKDKEDHGCSGSETK